MVMKPYKQITVRVRYVIT